ncbi:hypothetical protein L508_1569, partial [Bordetella bronchiseptica M435/02/3]
MVVNAGWPPRHAGRRESGGGWAARRRAGRHPVRTARRRRDGERQRPAR